MGKFKTQIVGSKFHPGATQAVELLAEGSELTLVPDPTNKYDEHAVKVLDVSDRMLGHIPMAHSQLVADMLNNEIAVEAHARYWRSQLWVEISYIFPQKSQSVHRDTGGPEQGGEFERGTPGHPDNDMGM